MQITNTQKGQRGINALTGPVLIGVGETIEAEVSPEEMEVAKATGWFEFKAAKPVKSAEAPKE